MKKQSILIVSTILAIGLLFTSCKNKEESKSEMKNPIENNEVNEKSEGKTPLNSDNAKTKTVVNLQTAFKGESNATARYTGFSKKAYEEGHKEIALLFKAASNSEKIHSANHKAVLEEMDIATDAIITHIALKSTKENLETAIKGESYEVAEIYPSFLKIANKANNQLALTSFNYAYKTEKKHKFLYEKALAALISNTDKTGPTTYFICPTCGNTYENIAPKRCGISMTNGEKFIKINSL